MLRDESSLRNRLPLTKWRRAPDSQAGWEARRTKRLAAMSRREVGARQGQPTRYDGEPKPRVAGSPLPPFASAAPAGAFVVGGAPLSQGGAALCPGLESVVPPGLCKDAAPFSSLSSPARVAAGCHCWLVQQCDLANNRWLRPALPPRRQLVSAVGATVRRQCVPFPLRVVCPRRAQSTARTADGNREKHCLRTVAPVNGRAQASAERTSRNGTSSRLGLCHRPVRFCRPCRGLKGCCAPSSHSLRAC